MIVRIVAVGRAKDPVATAIEDYLGRAGRYWRIEVEEVPQARGGEQDRERVLQEEAEKLLRRMPDEFQIVALTRKGRGMTSRAIAKLLGEGALRSRPGIAFVLGGAFGLGRPVLERADRTLSLSPQTLPHDLARLVLAEQLYRAGTILRNEPYHKGP